MKRALLIINRTAGTGQGDSVVKDLTQIFKQGLGELSQVKVELVSSHADARACTEEFVCASETPALVVAGGGGGTLRAVIEGVCDSRRALDRVRVGALRMGSGNVLAKQFGVPRDPVTALHGLLANLRANRTALCCVMRCETLSSAGNVVIHHAVTLGGLGQFGRIPSDLARWHARFPIVHKIAARSVGIEKLTNVEYALAFFVRFVTCLLSLERAEMVEIRNPDRTERLRLLAGIVMNFPIAALPFNPGVRVEDEALSVYLIPLSLLPRTRRIKVEKNKPLEIRFIDRDRTEFFLDEDPVTTYKQLRLSVAGSITFIPGPAYRASGVSA